MSVNVDIKNVTKMYGDFKAIDDVSLSIKEGEFFTLLGPSGCGKTTLLRMIAGFNSIEGGDIDFGGVRINNLPAHKRDIGMVFQNYAVFPHLSIYDNVGYGLKARKVPKEEAHDRIMNALETVQIADLKDRMPAALSGGQQQRVALARAIVIEPKILLMDEPLSNLDAKLRVQMRTIIKKLQRQLNITTIYVTHDQEEALAISDRIAVMNKGHVMQVDEPDRIYKVPANRFVSNFIGTSNFIKGVAVNNESIIIGDTVFPKLNAANRGDEVLVSIRPEQFIFADEGIKGVITLSTFLGDFVSYEVELENGQVVEVNEYTQVNNQIRPHGPVMLNLLADKVNIYDLEGTVNLNV
ncbi:ABC transporter ATP-binding protein [Erysipelothrix sp. HDW6C]|uniref:ABC transporter ATP-binding protein n=1 Tax=Erysipelothrix sp. HDW6C TaxID=2714930 RepID=UPI00140E289F|nr:ABC transporter ATP-binding protein [Erysipelothrix sp. HDW6C]QIK70500.1 ABC transporter ATP-binding protein [Erysipelothrix sp. HDW6C]